MTKSPKFSSARFLNLHIFRYGRNTELELLSSEMFLVILARIHWFANIKNSLTKLQIAGVINTERAVQLALMFSNNKQAFLSTCVNLKKFALTNYFLKSLVGLFHFRDSLADKCNYLGSGESQVVKGYEQVVKLTEPVFFELSMRMIAPQSRKVVG